MAKHVDRADELVGGDGVGGSADPDAERVPGERVAEDATAAQHFDDHPRNGRLGASAAAAVVVTAIVALGALGGWQAVRWQQQEADQSAQTEMVDAARQGAVALTTVDAANIDADVQKILGASTGQFRDDFAQRSQPFVDVVRQAQSKTEGTVTAAGIESMEGGQAIVLVTVTVKTTNVGQPEQEPRSWRMRITIDRGESGAKMSDVQFVP